MDGWGFGSRPSLVQLLPPKLKTLARTRVSGTLEKDTDQYDENLKGHQEETPAYATPYGSTLTSYL